MKHCSIKYQKYHNINTQKMFLNIKKSKYLHKHKQNTCMYFEKDQVSSQHDCLGHTFCGFSHFLLFAWNFKCEFQTFLEYNSVVLSQSFLYCLHLIHNSIHKCTFCIASFFSKCSMVQVNTCRMIVLP